MAIQYTVPGFELTTLERESPPISVAILVSEILNLVKAKDFFGSKITLSNEIQLWGDCNLRKMFSIW